MYLRPVVVLLDKRRHDGGCYEVARPAGAAAGGLKQLGAGPHELQIRLAEVMFAV